MKTVTLCETEWYPVYIIDDEPSTHTTEISDDLLEEYNAVMAAFDVIQEKVRILLEQEYAQMKTVTIGEMTWRSIYEIYEEADDVNITCEISDELLSEYRDLMTAFNEMQTKIRKVFLDNIYK